MHVCMYLCQALSTQPLLPCSDLSCSCVFPAEPDFGPVPDRLDLLKACPGKGYDGGEVAQRVQRAKYEWPKDMEGEQKQQLTSGFLSLVEMRATCGASEELISRFLNVLAKDFAPFLTAPLKAALPASYKALLAALSDAGCTVDGGIDYPMCSKCGMVLR